MINPKDTLNAIQAAFIADAAMLDALQLTGKTAVEKAQGIIKRSFYTDLASGKSRLCIYFRPSRYAANQLAVEDVLQIDCHVPVSRDMYAYDALRRVFELTHEKKLGNHAFYWDGMLGDLPTAQNYFCAGARLKCYATTKNP